MTTTPATRPTTVPMPKLQHEGVFAASLNGVTKGRTRTGKDCIRLSLMVPFSDSLAYRGGKAVVVKTISLPDPDQSGFNEAYQEAEAVLNAFQLPATSDAMGKLFDSVDAPLAAQKEAWRQCFVACLGKPCTIEVERYDIASDTGDTITGFSVNKVSKPRSSVSGAAPRLTPTTPEADRTDTESAVTSHGTTVEVASGTRDQSIVDSVASTK